MLSVHYDTINYIIMFRYRGFNVLHFMETYTFYDAMSQDGNLIVC